VIYVVHFPRSLFVDPNWRFDTVATSAMIEAYRPQSAEEHYAENRREDAMDNGAHAANQQGQGGGVGQFVPDDAPINRHTKPILIRCKAFIR
jgi:hypothetical protein